MKMNIQLLITALLNLLLGNSFANNEFSIYKTTQSITIDGNLSEWQTVPYTDVFLNHENGNAGISSAQAQMLWDNNNLYIAFTVTDTDVSANFVNQDDPLYSNDDLVEMFFDFDGSGNYYLELGVNAKGVNYDFNIICPGGPCGSWNSDAVWDMVGLESAAIVNGTLNNSSDSDAGYTVEVKIPFSSLASLSGNNYVNVDELTSWRGNLFAINYNTGASTNAATDYLSMFNHNSFGFHQPSKFGTFNFMGQPTSVSPYKANSVQISVIYNSYSFDSEDFFSIRIVDTLGKVQLNKKDVKNSTFNFANLSKGLYIIETMQNGVKESTKVIIK